jgi:4-alpha-glucanotransferase
MSKMLATTNKHAGAGQDSVLSVLPKREAGVCMHLTSLPGPFGIGEIGDNAFRFIDTLATMGLSVWQFLPTGPTAYADSPYQSASIYAGNPLLIDLFALRDDGLVTNAEIEVFEDLPRQMIDFGELIPMKAQLLARAAERFAVSATRSQRLARDEFVAAHDRLWLHDYAQYEVLKAMHQQRAWREWDQSYAARDPDALRALEEAAHAQIDSIKSIQFIFFEQWRRLKEYAASKGVRLMGDLPIYVALDSADAWSRPDLLYLRNDGTPIDFAGVPPDYFSADGQRWGNPLWRWDRHAADGYQWWISRVRHAMTMFDLIRLDHFRGFEAYWAVPALAETARDGEWRPGPGEDLFNALQDALGRLPFVAEDLGVITPEVDALREQFGFPGMKVLQFMVVEAKFDAERIPRECVCYTGTHDNDTTLGWFHNGLRAIYPPVKAQRVQAAVLRHTHGHPENIHENLIRLAFSTQASLAIAPMQDYLGLGSMARMNAPGTTNNNWQWRLRNEQITPHLCELVRHMVTESGRGESQDVTMKAHGK